MKTTWTCPHCWHENTTTVPDGETNYISQDLEYCDSDNGGCDELVPIQYRRTVTVTATPIQIKPFKTKKAA